MKKLFLSLSAIAIVSLLGACKKNNSAPANAASVMFVNAAAGTSAVSVSANNAPVSGASSIAFTKNSGYQSITAGASVPVTFSVIGSGLTTPLISGSSALTVNGRYSIFAGGIFTAPSYVITSDDLTPPTGSNVKIRFINLSSDNLNASCFVGNTKLDSNITYKGYSAFSEISPVTDKITMLDPIAPTNTAQLLGQTLAPGKIYTVMLTGTSSGTGTAALGLTIISNN